MYGLSQALMDAIGTAYKPPQGKPLVAQPAPQQAQPKMGKGQLIAGILGDALSGALGQPGQFAATMRQRQAAEQEEAQWTRRQQSELGQYEQKKQIDQRYAGPEQGDQFTRMLRASGIDPASPEGQQMYRQKITSDIDPIVTTMLPNGKMFSGPRSEFASALAGGASPAPMPTAPVGKLRPLNGGPTVAPSGTFRPAY